MSAYFFGWFETSIRAIQKTPGCEFGILVLTLPLLERYLRETSGAHEGDLNEKFYDDLLVVIPELSTRDDAKKFWHIYRNGFLHQCAFSAERKTRRGPVIMSYGAISGHVPLLEFRTADDSFYVNPSPLADRVLGFIRTDQRTFAAGSSPNHPPPEVGYPQSWLVSERGAPPLATIHAPPTGNFPI